MSRDEKKWYHGYDARLLLWKTGILLFLRQGEFIMKKKQSLNITLAIFLGLVLGIVFGLFMPGRYEFLLPVVELITSLYMNALRMMIYPLVFCSLIVGVQTHLQSFNERLWASRGSAVCRLPGGSGHSRCCIL